MRLEVHFQIRIAGRATVIGSAALPRQAYQLSFAHALGNTHIKHVVHQRDTPLRVHSRYLQVQLATCAAVDVYQIEQYLGMIVFAALAARRPATRGTLRSVATKQFREKITEFGLRTRRASTGKFET